MANLSTNLSGYGAVTAVSITAEDGTFTDDVTVTDALTAGTVNGQVIASGSVASSNPATTYVRVGTSYFCQGAGAPVSVDVPAGSLYYNSSSATEYYKWGAAAGNWQLLQNAGAAGVFTSLSLTAVLFTSSYVQLVEMADPGGVANRVTLFSQDNGAGKTQLMVRCGNTAAQQLAIEP